MLIKLIVVGLILGYTITPCRSDELATYRKSLDYCAGQNMAKLDDGVSPANIVADALLSVCQRQTQVYFLKLATSQSSAYWVGYHGAVAKQFAVYVLQHRTTLRQSR